MEHSNQDSANVGDVETACGAEQSMQPYECDLDIAEFVQEIAEYEARTVDEQLRSDLAEIKAVYPDIVEKSVGEFGDEFLKLMISHHNPVIAYEVIRAKRLRETKDLPPNIGAVNNVAGEDKDFYTPAEVDKLTREDFRKNPRLLEVVRKSMLKWNR